MFCPSTNDLNRQVWITVLKEFLFESELGSDEPSFDIFDLLMSICVGNVKIRDVINCPYEFSVLFECFLKEIFGLKFDLFDRPRSH